jgi:hypothetical protein
MECTSKIAGTTGVKDSHYKQTEKEREKESERDIIIRTYVLVGSMTVGNEANYILQK